MSRVTRVTVASVAEERSADRPFDRRGVTGSTTCTGRRANQSHVIWRGQIPRAEGGKFMKRRTGMMAMSLALAIGGCGEPTVAPEASATATVRPQAQRVNGTGL